MKPLDWTRPLQSQDGRYTVKFLHRLNNDSTRRKNLVVLINKATGYESTGLYFDNGTYSGEQREKTEPSDIVNVPTTLTMFVNVYKNFAGQQMFSSYMSEIEAKRIVNASSHITYIVVAKPVTFEV